jgi:hypothetical protein
MVTFMLKLPHFFEDTSDVAGVNGWWETVRIAPTEANAHFSLPLEREAVPFPFLLD